MECRVLEIDDYRVDFKRGSAPAKSPQGISLTVSAGEIALVIGMEQVGKSRLLAAAAGNVPSKGKIRISGAAAGSPEAKRLVGYVPASDSLYPELTCIQYLGMFSEIFEVERHYRPYIMREALALVRLQDCEDTRISELSDDYRRRCLCLARALVHDPRLLVIDDVFTHVDNLQMKSFLDILNSIRRRGKALLLSGSQLGGFYELADQVCYLEDGVPFLQGRTVDLRGEMTNFHLFQLQTLNSRLRRTSAVFLSKLFSSDSRIISVRRNVQDPSLWRMIFYGSADEFNEMLRQMHANGMQVVSCWEDRSFFGQIV